MRSHEVVRRKVKVISTLGPASTSPEVIRDLVAAGADGFRLNTAHLQPAEVATLVGMVRHAEEEAGRSLAVLCDLAGPKLRVARGVRARALEAGERVTVGRAGTGAAIALEGFDPVGECHEGSRILLHDGKVKLLVRSVGEQTVEAEVQVGGELAGGMGVNLPDGETSLPSLTSRDQEFLAAAVAAGVDVLALSFVRRREDVLALRARALELGSCAPVVAKLEKAQAASGEVLEGILEVADAVMVARGDLGAETAPERVPVLQKEILRLARLRGVPAITATEMLESMIRETRPTRAEAADVANAVYDGSDALLLTAETAIGAHPVLAVAACARIVAEAEADPSFASPWATTSNSLRRAASVADAVAAAAVVAAEELGARALICFTASGATARLVARHRPTRPILALTPSAAVARALALIWGVEPCLSPAIPGEHEDVVELAEAKAREQGLVRSGDIIVITHGAPLGHQPATNLLRVHTVA